MGPPHSSIDARSVESLDARKKRAKLVGDSIKSLIGTFETLTWEMGSEGIDVVHHVNR